MTVVSNSDSALSDHGNGEDDDDSHSRFSTVLIEVSVGLASKLFDLPHCVRVHGVWGTAHDAVPASFSADFIFPTSILSHCVGLCHCADLEEKDFICCS